MNKQVFISISILISSFCSLAQITFQKTYGGTGFNEKAASVKQTSDGGFIFTGWTDSYGAGGLDIYLVKTNASGDTLWTKTYGGTDQDFGTSVQQTIDGGYIIAGGTNFGGFNDDAYLIKTDANGDTLWTRSFDGASEEVDPEVKQTADGGYILCGSIFSVGSLDVYLIKTDANGDTLWTKTYGGADYDYGNSVQQTTDGGYIIAGMHSYNAINTDVYLIKTDANGDTLWTRAFGTQDREFGNSVKQTADGGYIITGYTMSGGTFYEEVYLIKTNANGNLQWSRTFGGSGMDQGHEVLQTADGGYIIGGLTSAFGLISPNAYLAKTDTSGSILWSKTYGGTTLDYGYSVSQTTDGGFILSGETNSFGSGSQEVYLIKTDSIGNSGCNETIPPTALFSILTQVTHPVTELSSGVTITSLPLMIGSGSIVNPLCISTPVSEINEENAFNISPNPTASDFIISFNETVQIGRVEILNILGENIFSENIFNESKKEISLNSIPGGIYFVNVFDGEKFYCKKIIIEP